MPENVTRRVRYQGSSPFLSMLVQMLDDQGVEVRYEARLSEARGSDLVQDVIVNLSCDGTFAAIGYAVAKFKARVPRARVEIEKTPEDEEDDAD